MPERDDLAHTPAMPRAMRQVLPLGAATLLLVVLGARAGAVQILPTTTTTTSTTTTTTTAPAEGPSETTTTAPGSTTSTPGADPVDESGAAPPEDEGLELVALAEGDAGNLSMTAPEPPTVEPVSAGSGQVTVPLGPVTVTAEPTGSILDLSTTVDWQATVSATDFVSGDGGPGRRIPQANVGYWSGLGRTDGLLQAVLSLLLPTLAAGQPTASQLVSLELPRLAFSAGPVTLPGESVGVSWRPTVVISLPPDLEPGSYTGTITHSVG